MTAFPLDVRSTRTVVGAAFVIAAERNLSAHDACYAALAEAERIELVTADRRLAAACERAESVA
jgi:predicted nucleic acid-binding protein